MTGPDVRLATAAIVLAAGSGARFGATKQFLELAPGLRLVDAAVLAARDVTATVAVVLPVGVSWDGPPVSAVVPGGADRTASVRAGLAALPPDVGAVLVHDAAHPLAPAELLRAVVAAVLHGADAAVPVLPVADVVKRVGPDGSLSTVGRDGLGLAQVPMAFTRRALEAAHASGTTVWEDSQSVEAVGGRVVAVPGRSDNVHVVTPEDLAVARALHAARSRPPE